MDDPVLFSRVGALRNNLSVVSANLESTTWKPEQAAKETRAELLDSSLWTGLELTLVNEIRRFVIRLDAIERDLQRAGPDDNAAWSAAWTRYGEILTNSQSLMRECLEIIGTLAIRSKDLDRKALYVADELIRNCLILSIGSQEYYLLVNSLADTFSQARARIIRLRFPEWTLWDLPLAAHELGHVAAEAVIDREKKQPNPEFRELMSFLEKQRDSLVAMDLDLNRKHQAGGVQAKEAADWAMNRVHIFAADAFATYTVGPAYACAAIMLRLNPAIQAHREIPADVQRAYVVLSMLSKMNDRAKVGPYREVIERLTTVWNNTLDRSNPANRLSTVEKEYLGELAAGFQDVSSTTLMLTAAYPVSNSQSDGWRKAEGWYLGWAAEMRDEKAELQVPDPDGGKLRDVLNAIWLARLMSEDDLTARKRVYRDLEKVGQSLCNSIIAAPSGVARMRPVAS